DVLVILGCHRRKLFGGARRQRGSERSLAVVDVPDGADVHVRLSPLEYSLSHCRNLRISSICLADDFSASSCVHQLALGLEPRTSTLPRWRSTTELCQRSSASPQTNSSDRGRRRGKSIGRSEKMSIAR